MNIKANIEDTRKGFEESFASGDFYNRQTAEERFTDTDKEQTVNGIRFTPMKYEDFAEDGD